ncbi:hypothetical protein [Pseudobacteriovorax antillogorgiicola]|uniref:Uncharacterized protein n=1 Tax=Pseudobacteriovorax antillogorgiicola TaxID=1513793 RepID=A0A1Y6CXP2_9BACT|nr:hypothetical protein [Pseudobacteriovorax antillogorgiicola]TCS44275.1 hypothetical protein EDD56_13475 [Pseudobacteriovorax antillogorgiicola]SMF84371.1 hypothetical protein SAMN06296036_1543 [Pseudobacteriovorax antillogorgiicola]
MLDLEEFKLFLRQTIGKEGLELLHRNGFESDELSSVFHQFFSQELGVEEIASTLEISSSHAMSCLLKSSLIVAKAYCLVNQEKQ